MTIFKVRVGGAGLRTSLSLKVLVGAIVSLLRPPSTQLALVQAGAKSVLSVNIINTVPPVGSLRTQLHPPCAPNLNCF